MKKLFLAAFSLCCIMFTLAVVKVDAQAAASGTCGGDLTWMLDPKKYA